MTTPDEIDRLFVKTLTGDYDDDAPWDAVRRLQVIGSPEVFERAAKYYASNEEIKRARGIDVLAQLGVAAGKPHTAPVPTRDLVLARLVDETSIRVIASSLYALGHLKNLENFDIIIGFSDHEDSSVRDAWTYLEKVEGLSVF